jgi:GNAT superfamily N-acetyltransferase
MKRESIHVRPAKGDDIPAIGRIVVRSWQHTFDGLVSVDYLGAMSDDHQRQRHERMFSFESVVYRGAATEGGDVVGFCSGGPSRLAGYAAQNEIYAIYLMPGYERKGIGRRLFEHVATELAASGRRGLILTALSANPNRSFYESMGGVEAAAENLQLGSKAYPQVAFVWEEVPVARKTAPGTTG